MACNRGANSAPTLKLFRLSPSTEQVSVFSTPTSRCLIFKNCPCHPPTVLHSVRSQNFGHCGQLTIRGMIVWYCFGSLSSFYDKIHKGIVVTFSLSNYVNKKIPLAILHKHQKSTNDVEPIRTSQKIPVKSLRLPCWLIVGPNPSRKTKNTTFIKPLYSNFRQHKNSVQQLVRVWPNPTTNTKPAPFFFSHLLPLSSPFPNSS